MSRDGDRCWYCDGQFVEGRRPLTIDHVVPLSRGGTNDLENLRLACVQCNLRKGERDLDDFLGSPVLDGLRRAAARENARILGSLLPRSAYHHQALRWYGYGRWARGACHLSSIGDIRSPALVPCLSAGTWPRPASLTHA